METGAEGTKARDGGEVREDRGERRVVTVINIRPPNGKKKVPRHRGLGESKRMRHSRDTTRFPEPNSLCFRSVCISDEAGRWDCGRMRLCYLVSSDWDEPYPFPSFSLRPFFFETLSFLPTCFLVFSSIKFTIVLQ